MSETAPHWLPPLLPVNGTWEEIKVALYAVFEADFKQRRPSYKGLPVWWNRRIEPGEEYENGFWHLVDRFHQKIGQRLFDPRRAERLSWCAAVIANANDSAVTVWDYREGKGAIRTYLWAHNNDYVVILEKMRRSGIEIYMLVRAYHVDGESSRRSFRKKYASRCL